MKRPIADEANALTRNAAKRDRLMPAAKPAIRNVPTLIGVIAALRG